MPVDSTLNSSCWISWEDVSPVGHVSGDNPWRSCRNADHRVLDVNLGFVVGVDEMDGVLSRQSGEAHVVEYDAGMVVALEGLELVEMSDEESLAVEESNGEFGLAAVGLSGEDECELSVPKAFVEVKGRERPIGRSWYRSKVPKIGVHSSLVDGVQTRMSIGKGMDGCISSATSCKVEIFTIVTFALLLR